jgi:hypothetical protein
MACSAEVIGIDVEDRCDFAEFIVLACIATLHVPHPDATDSRGHIPRAAWPTLPKQLLTAKISRNGTMARCVDN